MSVVQVGKPGGRKVRVMFLDDMAWRHTEFALALTRRGREDVELHRAWTAEEAKELLHMYDFDQVFLDHDLDEEVAGAGTGMDVVNWILGLEEKPSYEVIVHSMNGPARFEMVRRLEDGGLTVRNLDFYSLLKALDPGRR